MKRVRGTSEKLDVGHGALEVGRWTLEGKRKGKGRRKERRKGRRVGKVKGEEDGRGSRKMDR